MDSQRISGQLDSCAQEIVAVVNQACSRFPWASFCLCFMVGVCDKHGDVRVVTSGQALSLLPWNPLNFGKMCTIRQNLHYFAIF